MAKKLNAKEQEALDRLMSVPPEGCRIVQFDHRYYESLSCWRTIARPNGSYFNEMYRISRDGDVIPV